MYQIQNNRSKLAVSACFILITAFVITGCSGASSKNEVQKDTSNITMAAIIEANKSQNILSRHGSIFVEDSTSDSEEVYYTYVSADYMYQKSGESNIVVSEEENWECDEDNGERTFYYYWFAMDENEEKVNNNNIEEEINENSNDIQTEAQEYKIEAYEIDDKEEIAEKFKGIAIKRYQEEIVVGQKPQVGDILENQTFSQNPDGTGKKGDFSNFPEATVSHINIITPEGWKIIKDKDKSLAELLEEYPDYETYSIHFKDNKTGSTLGFLPKEKYEQIILDKVNKIIEKKVALIDNDLIDYEDGEFWRDMW